MRAICGIVGFKGSCVTSNDLEVLKQVMIESRIRGMHASGIAWFDGKGLQSFVKPIPIDRLVEQFDFTELSVDGSISMIAHARYSTSDIRYNQPIVGEKLAIAHNGVLTQSNPDTWEETYGYKCKTQNDSELLLHMLEDGNPPEEVLRTSSIAALTLDGTTGELVPLRNSLRPLWTGKVGNSTIYASTYDILNRAGVSDISKVKPVRNQDLQRRDYRQWNEHKKRA